MASIVAASSTRCSLRNCAVRARGHVARANLSTDRIRAATAFAEATDSLGGAPT